MSERLRDGHENWGLTPHEYAKREKARLRARVRQRIQNQLAAKCCKPTPVPDALLKPRRVVRPLTSPEGLELALCAVDGPSLLCDYRASPVTISLPFLSFQYERRL